VGYGVILNTVTLDGSVKVPSNVTVPPNVDFYAAKCRLMLIRAYTRTLKQTHSHMPVYINSLSFSGKMVL